MTSKTPSQTKPVPDLHIPRSNAIVKVSVIDSTTRISLPISKFLQPDYVGKTKLQCPAFSFLIEHLNQKPILFDLAVRYDWQSLPGFTRWRKNSWAICVEKDVATILKDHGVDVDGGAIGAVIWSHHHFDHTGDMSLFPHSTELVVGPGFKKSNMPGFPTNPNASHMEKDTEGRNMREIDISKEGYGMKIGRFYAYDYFGDGSLYLLDTPGHSVGHICALARTTPDTFLFMGGDASHHGGEFRPTEFLPIPKEISPSPLKKYNHVCPGHFFEEINPDQSSKNPFYHVTKNFANDQKLADWTVDGLGEFDCQDNVFLLIAHDYSVVEPAQFDFYPKTINDWHEKGIAKKVKWRFLSDFEGAVEEKQRGGEPFKWADDIEL